MQLELAFFFYYGTENYIEHGDYINAVTIVAIWWCAGALKQTEIFDRFLFTNKPLDFTNTTVFTIDPIH